MKPDVNKIFALLEQEDFGSALALSETVIAEFMTSFMENLTVNTATDYAGAVILYARICGAIKKPWKAFPKLEAARGALRFLKDYMADSETLAETYQTFADAYSYGGFLPEAVTCYMDAARFFESSERAADSLASALFYEERFGKPLINDFVFAEEKFGASALEEMKKKAASEASEQIFTDPVENTDEYLKIRFEVEEKTDAIISQNSSNDLPFCALYWSTKKMLLKEQYNIEWKSPDEMNPNIRFY